MERLKPQLVGSLSCLANLFQFVFCLLLFVFYSLYFVFMRRMKRQFVGVLLPSCQPFLATYTILTGQLTSYHTLVIVAMVFIMSMGMRHKYFFLFWGDANKNNTHWSSWPLSPNAEGLISVLPFSQPSFVSGRWASLASWNIGSSLGPEIAFLLISPRGSPSKFTSSPHCRQIEPLFEALIIVHMKKNSLRNDSLDRCDIRLAYIGGRIS